MTARPDAGSRCDVAVTRVRALGGVDLVRARFVDHATPPHAHSELEIGVVVSGGRLVTWRGGTIAAPHGSILVFNPGEAHAGAPLGGASSVYRSFLLPVGALDQVPGWSGLGGSTGRWFATPVIRDHALARRLAAAHQALERPAWRPEVEKEMISALDELAQRHGEQQPRVDDSPATRRVKAYLEEHYAEPIRLETLSTISGVGIYQLIRVFRRATGLPPYAYLEQIRVARAAVLLREGHPLSQIAARTGFSDQSHLTRFFKRIVGVPPGRYRRSVLDAANGAVSADGRAGRRRC